jgi:hypothetical protein
MSDNLVVDLTNYKDRVGTRVLPGRYRVQVEDVEASESSNHNPMINLWLRIVGGESDGQTVVDRLTLTEKSLFRVVGFMQAIGLPTPKKRLQVRIQQWVGKTLEIDVEDGEPYNGRVKSEVRGYIKIAKANAAKDSGDDLEGLVGEGEGIGAVEPEPGEEPEPTTATAGGGIPSDGGVDTKADAAATPQAEAEDEEVDLDKIDL